jgi:hypothetical protein
MALWRPSVPEVDGDREIAEVPLLAGSLMVSEDEEGVGATGKEIDRDIVPGGDR